MSYDESRSFVTWAEVEGRLTQYGARAVIDADEEDGAASEDEKQQYFEPAAIWADNKIDEAIYPWVNILNRPVSNAWLRDRALDLCVFRMHTLGGEDDTDVLKVAFDNALADLEKVRTGALRVPGLDTQGDDDVTDFGRRTPSIAAVKNIVPRCALRRGYY
jgi:hypothetical protein